jgi:hypothetical protein
MASWTRGSRCSAFKSELLAYVTKLCKQAALRPDVPTSGRFVAFASGGGDATVMPKDIIKDECHLHLSANFIINLQVIQQPLGCLPRGS